MDRNTDASGRCSTFRVVFVLRTWIRHFRILVWRFGAQGRCHSGHCHPNFSGAQQNTVNIVHGQVSTPETPAPSPHPSARTSALLHIKSHIFASTNVCSLSCRTAHSGSFNFANLAWRQLRQRSSWSVAPCTRIMSSRWRVRSTGALSV